MNVLGALGGIGAAVAVVIAALLGLRKDGPKNNAEAMKAYASTALDTMHGALETTKAELIETRHRLDDVLAQLDLALAQVHTLRDEVETLSRQARTYESLLALREAEITRLTHGVAPA